MTGPPVAVTSGVMKLVQPMTAFLVLLCSFACAGPTAPSVLPSTTVAGIASIATPVAPSVLSLTNAERRRAGLAELRESRQLASAAQLQSEQMGSISRMDHVLPGVAYPAPPDRLAAVNYSWTAYGENVAMGQRSASEVVDAWMQSPGHRANILNPQYTELGVGFAFDASGRPYYAQVFARPAR